MTYFLTALYYEAEDIIAHYKMKKVMEAAKFQVFKGEDEVLIISGTGALKAVIAATYAMDMFKYNENDVFINIGICGAYRNFSEGEIVLCNKLIDSFAKRSFYPDMLFRHPFREGSLESFPEVIYSDKAVNIEADIVDQEGAFVYETAAMFLKPHNIHIIKIVSDLLKPDKVTPQRIKMLIAKSMPEIYDWLELRNNVKLENRQIIDDEETSFLSFISEKLHLTAAMKVEFEKLSKQYKVRNGHITDVLKEYAELKCEYKNEGKKIFVQIRNRLMEL